MAFNNIGWFTIAPGQSYRIDGWYFPGHGDMGAQYFSAHPLFRDSDSMLISSDQSKRWIGAALGGHAEYGFRVTYLTEISNEYGFFNVQGGGFV